jgi:hypothetical protein
MSTVYSANNEPHRQSLVHSELELTIIAEESTSKIFFSRIQGRDFGVMTHVHVPISTKSPTKPSRNLETEPRFIAPSLLSLDDDVTFSRFGRGDEEDQTFHRVIGGVRSQLHVLAQLEEEDGSRTTKLHVREGHTKTDLKNGQYGTSLRFQGWEGTHCDDHRPRACASASSRPWGSPSAPA